MEDLLLDVQNLSVTFDAGRRDLRAVHDVNLTLRRGEVLAIVGESGCGKSVTASTIVGLTRGPRTRIGGRILYGGRDLAQASEAELRDVRGKEIAMVFQDALAALNPVHRVGDQVAEMVRLHNDVRRDEAFDRAVRMLDEVGVANAPAAALRYPHEYSGGMRQRAVTAIALVNNPPVLIADEPTTALDVTIQAQVLDLIDRLRRDHGTAVILITHDLGVVAQFADRVVVMYAGTVVEEAPTEQLFRAPQHPYTWGLLACVPRLDGPRLPVLASIEGSPPPLTELPVGCRFHPRCRFVHERCFEEPALLPRSAPGHLDACVLEPERKVELRPVAAVPRSGGVNDAPLVEVDDLAVHYHVRHGGDVRAVDGVSLTIRPGKTLGLVGESGCGKSTLGRAVLRLVPITRGTVRFEGADITNLRERSLRAIRPKMQVIFQDPFSSLNPLKRVARIVGEPLAVHGVSDRRQLAQHVEAALARVGLPPDAAERYPREFSGGQRQRIAIARALALHPTFVVADEPVSALDVSIQAQVINLLERLQREEGLAYLFISHDLGVIRHVADDVAVMYLGRIVEHAPQEALFARPLHPYTEALMSAVPAPDPALRGRSRIVLSGDLPNPSDPPPGCTFHTRCRYATEICRTVFPPLVDHGDGHLLACHHPLDGSDTVVTETTTVATEVNHSA